MKLADSGIPQNGLPLILGIKYKYVGLILLGKFSAISANILVTAFLG